jgi:hypothetical protein
MRRGEEGVGQAPEEQRSIKKECQGDLSEGASGEWGMESGVWGVSLGAYKCLSHRCRGGATAAGKAKRLSRGRNGD